MSKIPQAFSAKLLCSVHPQGAGKMLLDDAKKPGGDKSWCETSSCSLVSTSKAGWVSIAAAAGSAVVFSAILIPILKKRAQARLEEDENQ